MAEHGTYTMYARNGCRCESCREYQNSRVRRNRADRLENRRLAHGTRSAYDAGCRCVHCRNRRAKISFDNGESKTPGPFGRPKHNHITRDIKPYGVCPGCDDYHAGVR